MADMAKVHAIMQIPTAMRMYGTSDKEKFECSYPEYQEQRPESTFYADFSVADCYGEQAIQDTYNHCNGWRSNCKMWTELTAMLNHKLWFWHEHGITEYAELYDRLWKQADAYGCNHFKGEEARYFFSVLDQYNIINQLSQLMVAVGLSAHSLFHLSQKLSSQLLPSVSGSK